jgi:hypothetical protein
MANTQINVTKNGTTILATAGKYCDRNIDVNVNVPAQPTQFTNLYDPANVQLKKYSSASNANGWVISDDSECNCLKIPYQQKANEPVALRMRGIGTVRSRLAYVLVKEDGVATAHYGQLMSYSSLSYDEYGDAVLTFTGSFINRDWSYLYLNFQYIGIQNNATTALTGPIVTINEPIGNGGYTG